MKKHAMMGVRFAMRWLVRQVAPSIERVGHEITQLACAERATSSKSTSLSTQAGANSLDPAHVLETRTAGQKSAGFPTGEPRGAQHAHGDATGVDPLRRLRLDLAGSCWCMLNESLAVAKEHRKKTVRKTLGRTWRLEMRLEPIDPWA